MGTITETHNSSNNREQVIVGWSAPNDRSARQVLILIHKVQGILEKGRWESVSQRNKTPAAKQRLLDTTRKLHHCSSTIWTPKQDQPNDYASGQANEAGGNRTKRHL